MNQTNEQCGGERAVRPEETNVADQFSRLNATDTVASFTRKFHAVDQGDSSSLGLHLSSIYDQHCHWWCKKEFVVQQGNILSITDKETNDAIVMTNGYQKTYDDTILINKEVRSIPNEYVKISLGAYHLPKTQKGYGRKIN